MATSGPLKVFSGDGATNLGTAMCVFVTEADGTRWGALQFDAAPDPFEWTVMVEVPVFETQPPPEGHPPGEPVVRELSAFEVISSIELVEFHVRGGSEGLLIVTTA